jgi:hypothetical protein
VEVVEKAVEVKDDDDDDVGRQEEEEEEEEEDGACLSVCNFCRAKRIFSVSCR